jgi:hypothetical protein
VASNVSKPTRVLQLREAAKDGRIDDIKQLASASVDVNSAGEVLWGAARAAHSLRAHDIGLAIAHADQSAAQGGTTALMLAACFDRAECITELARLGAILDAQDPVVSALLGRHMHYMRLPDCMRIGSALRGA